MQIQYHAVFFEFQKAHHYNDKLLQNSVLQSPLQARGPEKVRNTLDNK